MSRALTRLAYYDPPAPLTQTLSTASIASTPSTSRKKVSFLLPETKKFISDGSSTASSDSSLPSVDQILQVSPRQDRKCRDRTARTSWFEAKSLKLLSQPQVSADALEEFEDGDLLVNWLDSDLHSCQIWAFTGGGSGRTRPWRSMGWGSKKMAGAPHRLVITTKGYPSFVAESTWRKKYKQSPARIRCL